MLPYIPPAPDDPPAPPPTPLNEAAAVNDYIANRLANGVPAEVVEKELMQQGVSKENASALVTHVLLDPIRRRRSRYPQAAPLNIALANSQSGQKKMLVGGLVCVIGLVITFASLASAGNGGRYVVAWGAIVFGAIQFLRGLAESKG